MLCVSQRQWENGIKFKWQKNIKGLRCVPIHLPLSRATSANHTSPMSLFTLACPNSLAVFCFACSVWFLYSESESMWTAEKFSSALTDIQKPAVGFGFTCEGAEKFSSVRTDRCACSFLPRTIHWSGPSFTLFPHFSHHGCHFAHVHKHIHKNYKNKS